MPDAVVRRPAVVRSLLRAGDGDVVVMTAPAGYGKTVAATLWDRADKRPFAWSRIDYLDNDPAHLLLHIATAVAGVHSIDPSVLRYLRGPGRAPLNHLVPALVHALEECGPLVVVLDDVHELSDSGAVAVLQALADSAPATTTLVLIGRTTPPLDLARRRLQRRLVEIGIPELELSGSESAAVFAAVSGQVADAVAEIVHAKCEGWVAGVVLAALALRGGADVSALTGRNRLVADYLLEEVLAQLDSDTTTFLMESAIFDRFCGALLDELRQRDNSAKMLNDITRSDNPFLIPLDAERVWYRYHNLVGDLLRARLRDAQPERYRVLATRAANLLERQGDVDGALVRVLAAGDRARAAALVEREAVRLGFDGRAGVLARRVNLLDEQTFVQCPDAAIARAWLGVTTGDADMIQRSLVMASHADTGRPLADRTPSVKLAAALVGSVVGVGGVAEVVRHADVVRAAGDHLVNPWWGAATVMKGAALSMMGEPARARVLLAAALPVVTDLPGFHAAALAHLALLDLGDGDDAQAVERSLAARTIADRADLCDVVPMVVVYAAAAVIAARIGDVPASRAAVAATERLLDRLGDLAARTALLGHGLLAWTAAGVCDTDLVRRHLTAAERAARLEPDALGLVQRLDRVRLLAAGGKRRLLTAAELRLLPHLATHLSLQRIADDLMLSRETVKSQATSIYRKLNVSSRAAAVAEARRVGLLTN